MSSLARCGAVFACVLTFAGLSHATPLTGELNIFGDVAVGATTIDWLPAGGGTGTLTVGASSTGSFAGLAGSTGMSTDLNSATTPVGVPVSLANFLTLPGGISFTLTQIDAGVFGAGACASAPAAGQDCTPPGSPFNLTNTAVGSTASFTVHGQALQNGVIVSNFIGTYTTQFTGESYQQLLATIGGGGAVNASYSANFVVSETTVPEPSTVFLALGGLLLAAGTLRHKLVRK